MTDPYLDENRVIQRLWNEYLKHGKLIVALDVDDTFFDFHGKGYSYPAVVKLVKKCQELGFYIVIFTASVPERYDSILSYCESVGIKPCGINKNAIPSKYGNNGKVYYNILLDDRSGLASAYRTLKAVVDRILAGADPA